MLRSIGKQSGESVEYSDRALSLIIRRISSDADRWFVMVTPRIFSTFSRDMLSSGCCSVSAILRLEFWNTISFPLETFSLRRLFAAAHVAMLSISCWHVLALTDRTTRHVSSANFTSELPGCGGFRSAAVTVYAAGTMPDPWMGGLKTRDWKSQDWKTWDQIAGVEIGKDGTGKRRNIMCMGRHRPSSGVCCRFHDCQSVTLHQGFSRPPRLLWHNCWDMWRDSGSTSRPSALPDCLFEITRQGPTIQWRAFMPLYSEESVSHPNLFAFLSHLQRTTVDSQHWRRQGRQGAQAPQWPGKNFC